ncbi:hypothetical protein ES702_06598 [subsurface metagenome]
MRTKDEILDSCRNDIVSEAYKDKAAFWLDYRKIEVLIDIRDILNGQVIDLEKTTRENIKIPK